MQLMHLLSCLKLVESGCVTIHTMWGTYIIVQSALDVLVREFAGCEVVHSEGHLLFFNYTCLNGCATNLLSLVCVELSRDFSNNDLCGTIPVTGSFTRLQAKRLVQKWQSFVHGI